MVEKIADQELKVLLDAARQGTKKAFLTKEGGDRYGAAVITKSGKIFSAGQYSSFNHITNIHAEMAVVLMATMAGEADIKAIALLSTKAVDEPERMCGICRQFLSEHSLRTGIPVTVYFSNYDSTKVEEYHLEELLPYSWKSNK